MQLFGADKLTVMQALVNASASLVDHAENARAMRGGNFQASTLVQQAIVVRKVAILLQGMESLTLEGDADKAHEDARRITAQLVVDVRQERADPVVFIDAEDRRSMDTRTLPKPYACLHGQLCTLCAARQACYQTRAENGGNDALCDHCMVEVQMRVIRDASALLETEGIHASFEYPGYIGVDCFAWGEGSRHAPVLGIMNVGADTQENDQVSGQWYSAPELLDGTPQPIEQDQPKGDGHGRVDAEALARWIKDAMRERVVR